MLFYKKQMPLWGNFNNQIKARLNNDSSTISKMINDLISIKSESQNSSDIAVEMLNKLYAEAKDYELKANEEKQLNQQKTEYLAFLNTPASTRSQKIAAIQESRNNSDKERIETQRKKDMYTHLDKAFVNAEKKREKKEEDQRNARNMETIAAYKYQPQTIEEIENDLANANYAMGHAKRGGMKSKTKKTKPKSKKQPKEKEYTGPKGGKYVIRNGKKVYKAKK